MLTPGDVGLNFLPFGIKWMRAAAWLPGAMGPLARFWNTRLGRALIMAPLTRRRPAGEILDSWFAPATRDRDLRRDLARLLRSATPRATLRAGRQLDRFRGSALVVWTKPANLVFPLLHGRRLAGRLGAGQVELIGESRAFIPEDQPQALAQSIGRFRQGDSRALRERAAPARKRIA